MNSIQNLHLSFWTRHNSTSERVLPVKRLKVKVKIIRHLLYVPTSPNYGNKQAAPSASRIDLSGSPRPGGDSRPNVGQARLGGVAAVDIQSQLGGWMDGGVGQGRLSVGGVGQIRLGVRKASYSLGTVNSLKAEPRMPVVSI